MGCGIVDENREVTEACCPVEPEGAAEISGGDRHGILSRNAKMNLRRARQVNFAGFVREVRRERISNVLFMPQYAEPWKHRLLSSTLAAIRNYPEFPATVYERSTNAGCRRQDETAGRAPWTRGHAPVYLSAILTAVRIMGAGPVSTGLRLAWNDANAMRTALSGARRKTSGPRLEQQVQGATA